MRLRMVPAAAAANKIDLSLQFVAGIQFLLTNNFFYYKISQLYRNWHRFRFYITDYMFSCMCQSKRMFETSCNKIKAYQIKRVFIIYFGLEQSDYYVFTTSLSSIPIKRYLCIRNAYKK